MGFLLLPLCSTGSGLRPLSLSSPLRSFLGDTLVATLFSFPCESRVVALPLLVGPCYVTRPCRLDPCNRDLIPVSTFPFFPVPPRPGQWNFVLASDSHPPPIPFLTGVATGAPRPPPSLHQNNRPLGSFSLPPPHLSPRFSPPFKMFPCLTPHWWTAPPCSYYSLTPHRLLNSPTRPDVRVDGQDDSPPIVSTVLVMSFWNIPVMKKKLVRRHPIITVILFFRRRPHLDGFRFTAPVSLWKLLGAPGCFESPPFPHPFQNTLLLAAPKSGIGLRSNSWANCPLGVLTPPPASLSL